MFVGLVKTSLVNFPGRVAAAVFLPGCNLRCPFCHNAELAAASVVSGPRSARDEESGYVTIDDVYAHLEKRKGVLGGLAISGGEPLLSPALTGLVAKARELGLAVKIDTNGTLPDRLAAMLGESATRPDMIAIDVKTTPDRYGELATEPTSSPAIGNALLASLEILEREKTRCARENARPLKIEYRTVLVPGLVGESEIREIARLLPHDADWEFAPFHPGTCLDPALNDLAPYGPEETKRLVAVARGLRPGARLR
jgi:pyruvate formate lyase activating enzyme